MLRDRGYATGGVVSAFVLRKETGIGQGFEFFDGDMPAPPPGPIARPVAARRRRIRSESPSVGSTRTANVARLPVPASRRTARAVRAAGAFAEFSPYDGEIAYADEIVGRLIHYLKSHQLYDRSTIVLLSDHGEGLGDHGEQEHGLFVYDEAIHVPLIIKQEATPAPGRRVRTSCSTSTWCRRSSISSRRRCPATCAAARSSRCSKAPAGRCRWTTESLYGRAHFGWSAITAQTGDRTPAPVVAEPIEDAAKKSEIVNSYRRALALAADSRWREAIPILQAILRQDVEMAEVWRLLGTVAARKRPLRRCPERVLVLDWV